MLKVTTSWDDGDILDKRLADLLSKYGTKGTFYITKNYRPHRLSENDIRELSQTHEIGAHTLTHPDLRTVSMEKMKEEIAGSKTWLEEVLEKKIAMFCYPKGFYSEEAITVVKAAGFVGARTTELGSMGNADDPFKMPTSIQVYPFPFRKIDQKKMYWGKLIEPWQQRSAGLRSMGVPITSFYSWLSMAKAAFDAALRNGEVFHIWGHSWEIEKYGMWEDLEKLFAYISHHPQRHNCSHVTNSGALRTLSRF